MQCPKKISRLCLGLEDNDDSALSSSSFSYSSFCLQMDCAHGKQCRTQDKSQQETRHRAVFAKRLLPFSELLLSKSQA